MKSKTLLKLKNKKRKKGKSKLKNYRNVLKLFKVNMRKQEK